MKKAFNFHPFGSAFTWVVNVLIQEYYPDNTDKNRYHVGRVIDGFTGEAVDSDLVADLMDDIEAEIDRLVGDWYGHKDEDAYINALADMYGDWSANPAHYGTTHAVATRPAPTQNNPYQGFGPTADVEAAQDFDMPLWVVRGY